MRSKALGVLVFMLFMLVGLSPAAKAEQQPVLVCDVQGMESEAEEFEAAVKELRTLQAKYGGPSICCEQVYLTNDFHYYFFTQLDDMASLNDFFSYYITLAENAGEEWDALMEQYTGTFETETMGTFYLRSDLSNDGYNVYAAHMWPELPLYIVWGPANDIIQVDYYYIKSGKWWMEFENLARSIPLQDLYNNDDIVNICRRIEHRTAYLREDLSSNTPPVAQAVVKKAIVPVPGFFPILLHY
jgi:hypothetical protein